MSNFSLEPNPMTNPTTETPMSQPQSLLETTTAPLIDNPTVEAPTAQLVETVTQTAETPALKERPSEPVAELQTKLRIKFVSIEEETLQKLEAVRKEKGLRGVDYAAQNLLRSQGDIHNMNAIRIAEILNSSMDFNKMNLSGRDAEFRANFFDTLLDRAERLRTACIDFTSLEGGTSDLYSKLSDLIAFLTPIVQGAQV